MVAFLYALREAGIPADTRDLLEFIRGLKRGLAPDPDRLYWLARLAFVNKLEHYDAFDRVFSWFFLGAGTERGVPALDEDELRKLEEWLRRQLEGGLAREEDVREFDADELLRLFRRVLDKQRGEHHHGNTWIGTGGGSAFGHGGELGGGLRVDGEGIHGTAQRAIARRRYVDYSETSTLTVRSLNQVLSLLKGLRPAGPPTELDVDETIYKTAANGGEIELVFRPETVNRLDLLVLMDNGGSSMIPYVEPVKAVFQRIRGLFRETRHYYFHNCVYGVAYKDAARAQPVSWRRLTGWDPDAAGPDAGGLSRHTRLVVIGDADMAPAELMAAAGSPDVARGEKRPGIEWLRELRRAYPVSAWLNPIPKPLWRERSSTVAAVAGVFPMEDLTLGGIRRAVEKLNEQGETVRLIG